MHIEEIKSTGSLAADITRHYSARILMGKAVVVAEDPDLLEKALQKQWARLTRRLQAQRTQTPSNKVATVMDLTFAITKMQCQRFTTQLPLDDPSARVFILRPTDLNDILPEFATLYITCAVGLAVLESAAATMPANGTVIRYL